MRYVLALETPREASPMHIKVNTVNKVKSLPARGASQNGGEGVKEGERRCGHQQLYLFIGGIRGCWLLGAKSLSCVQTAQQVEQSRAGIVIRQTRGWSTEQPHRVSGAD